MALRSGTGPLHLEGHILVLNCNGDLVPVMKQLTAAAQNRNHPFHGRAIVVLAEEDKERLTSLVDEVFMSMDDSARRPAIEVHTRCGRPYAVTDLVMVSAPQAAYVVLLYPSCFSGGLTPSDQAGAEAMKAATVAAMSTMGGRFGSCQQHIVVQVIRVFLLNASTRYTSPTLLLAGGLMLFRARSHSGPGWVSSEFLFGVQVPSEVPEEYQQLETVQELLAAEGAHVQAVRIPETKLVDR